MKIYKPIGSKERFVEVFQRVNKVKLNENLMEAGSPNLNPENVLNVAFNQLKNNQLKIEHSNTQEKGDENFVELLCTDNQGNNISFIFRAISSEGDQEGVYNISNVLLNSFSFDSPDGQDTLDLDENGLKQFNMQHAQEMMDVIDKYVDVASPENVELEEAVKLIDAIKQNSYPFGGGDDRLQTGKNYADFKPTNPKVRVSSPELEKFVQEDVNPIAPVGKKITTKEELKAYVQQKKANGGKFGREDAPLLAGEALYYMAVKIADSMLPMGWDGLADVNSMWDYIRKDGGMSFDQLKAAVKRAVNVRLKEEGYSLKDLGLGENMNLPIAGMPSATTNVAEQEDDDIAGQEINRFKQEIQPQNPEEVDVDDEPAPELSSEKKNKILAAYDSLTAKNKNSNYSPTIPEVMAELDKMSGKVVKKTPKPPIDFSNYIEENSEESKQSIIMQAAKKVAEDLKRTGKSYVYEEFIPLVKEEALKMYNNIQRMSLAEGENVDYPDPLGKEFKAKEHYPKQKKKRSKKVKLGEQETYGDEDISGLPNPPAGREAKDVAKKDISQYFTKKGNTDPRGGIPSEKWAKYPLPYDTKFDYNEDVEEPEVEPETEPETNDQMSHQPMNNEPKTDDGMSHEPEGDDVAQIAQDKEEVGELIPGGKGEGKSPLEFSPDQILKGMKVEMEHTEDPMISLEITLDHLAEDPEYYTEKDTPETSAQFGAAKDAEEGGEDKEMTDVLLGFEPHNVGDEVDIEGDEEPEVTPPEEPEPANEPDKTPAEEVPAEEPEEKLQEAGEKFSTIEKNKLGMTYLFAYPDAQGIETRDGLDSWESQDSANRQLQFVNSREEAASALDTFGESKKVKPVITEEQIKLAKTTLNRNIQTGMTKKEAVTILMNNNLRKIL